MPGKRYISVILPLKLGWEPCYRCREDEMPSVGDRVRVAFAGNGKGREYIGIVSGTDIEPEIAEDRIKDIVGIEQGLVRISEQEIALWRTVADYYMCSIGEVYKAAYPAQKIQGEEVQARMEARAQKKTEQEEAKRKREEEKKAKEKAREEEKIQKKRERLEKTEERLSKAKEKLSKAQKDSVRDRLTAEIHELEKAAAEIAESLKMLTGNVSAGNTEAENTEATASSITEGTSYPDIQAMIGRKSTDNGIGPVAPSDIQMVNRGSYADGMEPTDLISDGITLSDAQNAAYIHIKEAFRKRQPVLLKGVTGAGKTEIYIKLATDCLNAGKNVLYLVPEIALSRQLEYRLEKIFGTRLMAFHSGESIAQRRETASAVRQGQRTVLLGTRSALFLPHHDLGLIIVDEEHDSSYKQDSPAPRYNGRDTAVMLAGIHGCSILLGSATPSLESMHNCDTGKYALVTLDVRYHASEDADIEIIDTIAERKKRGMKGSFSIKLIEHINETLSKGRQVLLFRARRSFSPAMQCTSCGHIPKCPHCNASLSWHKSRRSGQEASGTAENAEMMYDGAAAGGRLVCHLCGYSRPFSEKCPECGGELRGLGAGTQKVEEEAAALFPGARIARLDSDTARSASYGKETIKAFARGEIDILIGTQMVTKGFDFPNLSLVAVLQADTLMSVQDFRADEKAAQLLEQFMGRCGRRGAKGLFVVQTSMPDHPVYSIIRGRMTGSEGSLLNERKEFGFPPYTRLVNIVIRDTDEMRAARMGTKLAGLLENGTPPYTVTGPYIPAVDKVADNHIRIIRLGLRKDRQLAAVKRHLMKMLSEFMQKEKYEAHIVIDVDPS